MTQRNVLLGILYYMFTVNIIQSIFSTGIKHITYILNINYIHSNY